MTKVPFHEIHTLSLMNDLFEGNDYNEKDIYDFCDIIDLREDCNDFRMTGLLRLLYQFGDKLSDDVKERIKQSVLNFKYWIDEPGTDNMCYWSENHQILFAEIEYLAGQYYPYEKFTNTNMIGLDHIKKARPRITNWLQNRWNDGFIEWHSHVYYAEDLAALFNLIDFCDDPEIVEKSMIITDIMFFDMASHSYKGVFGTTHGRSYEKQKKAGIDADISPIICDAFGYDYANYDLSQIHSIFKYVQKYEVPDILKAIARDNNEVEIKDSMGYDLKEMKKLGYNMHDLETGMLLWSMEAFTNPQSIEATMDMLKKYDMLDNQFLSKFKSISHPLLRKLIFLHIFENGMNLT